MVEASGNGGPEIVDGAGGDLSQQRLELGEGHLDGVEVGRIGRREEQAGAGASDRLVDAGDLVAREVVPPPALAKAPMTTISPGRSCGASTCSV